MKTLFKIFFVAMAFVAYSCVTDATEDLGVNFDNGQTVISLSLEESRTQLGEKANDLYPVFWSKGDKISVNGVESNEAEIDEENGAKAKFTVDGTLNAPYEIAYPAAPEGQVIFAANQTHTSNTTFESGVSTMYGTSQSSVGASLKHLTGVLKIGITGNATLKHAQISTIDRAPIAGNFNLNFATGEVTPTASSVSTINYSFGNGLNLSTEASYIHVAVPAGVYDELYVTLYDSNNGVMYATIAAGESKPLSVGKVREFSNKIAYKANSTAFIIKDKASLKEFASQAASLTKDVLLVNDIDMSGEAWTPIKGFSNVFNGAGYAIKGLTAPLFETTSATIKGLHLEGVNITSSSLTAVGALVGTYTGTNISHCSASGNITLTKVVAAATSISGLVGSITTAENYTISDCVNNCAMNLTVSSTSDKKINIGGVVGFTADVADTVEARFSNNANHATITVATPEGGSLASQLVVGGILGYIGYVDTYIDGCHNTANVSANIAKTTGTTIVGGAAGAVYRATGGKTGFAVEAKNITNSGNVTVNVNSTAAVNVAGCFARLCDDKLTASMKVENFVNSGAVALNSDDSCTGKTYVGGIVAWGVNSMACKNLHNEATGTVTATMASKSGEEFHIGGLFGYLRALKLSDLSVTDSYNKAQITSNITSGECKHNVGGCFGLLFPFSSNAYKITLDNVDNYGGILINCETKKSDTNVGGVVGGMTDGTANTGTSNFFKIKNCNNVGDGKNKIHITNGSYGTFHVGGIIGVSFSHIDMDDCSNSMDYLFDADQATTTNMWGGCIARLTTQAKVEGRTTTIDNFTNTGNATVTPKTSISGYNVYSGFFSYMSAETYVHAVVANNIVNRGNTKVVTPQIINAIFVGGFGGFYQNYNSLTLSNSTNYGSIDITTEESKDNIFAGGFVSSTFHAGADLSFTNCHNEESATISVHAGNHKEDTNSFVGGLLGLPRVGVDLKNCSNKADVTVTGNFEFPTNTFYNAIGGVIGRFHGTSIKLDDVTNTGDVYVGTANKTYTTNTASYIGGIIGSLAGTAACTYNFTASIINTGDITLADAATGMIESTCIGGAVGGTAAPLSNMSALCDITAIGYLNVGMIMGTPYAETTKATNCQLGGSLTNSTKDEEQLGGQFTEVKVTTPITAENYFKHIYGTAITAEQAKADNVTLATK